MIATAWSLAVLVLAAAVWTACHSYLRTRRGRAAQDLSRALLDGANDALLLIDADGILIDSNSKAESLFSLPRARLIGMQQSELFQPCQPEPGAECLIWLNGDETPLVASSRRITLGGRDMRVLALRPVSEASTAMVLRDERHFIDSVLETVQALVMVLDRAGRITRFNKACEELTGYTFAEVRGRPFWDILLPTREIERTRQLFAELVNGKVPVQRENAWLARDTRERMIAWSNNVVTDAAGAVQYVIATGIDISARKSAEEGLRRAHDEMEKRVVLRTAALRAANDALVRSENRLAEAQRLAHIGSWEWDIESGRIVWSDEVFRMFGMRPGAVEASYSLFLSCIHPDDRPAVQAAVDNAVRHGATYSVEHRLMRPDGVQRTVLEQGMVARDSTGKPVLMTGTVQDITERKQAEEALRRAHDELEERVRERTTELQLANQALGVTQFAMDNAPDAVFWMTTELRFIYVNDAASRFLGYSRPELLNRGLTGIVRPTLFPEFSRHLDDTRGGQPLTFESLLLCRDHSELPVEITANHLFIDESDYICLFARDISERWRAEALRQAQLQAARTLSSISSRFVALDDVEYGLRTALAELRTVMDAHCAMLLRVTGRDSVALEWQVSCGNESCCPESDAESYVPALDALRQGEVVTLYSDPEQAGPATVLVPTFAEQVLVGAVVLKSARDVERWRDGDFPLLRVAARVLTSAIERHRAELQTIRLLEENRRLARQSLEIQERERAHLARELHDELGQCLTAIRADAQTICRLSEGRDTRIHESGMAIGQVASRVYEVVRNMMRRLRPEMLDELGLGQALQDIVQQWRGRHPEMDWRLDITEPLGTLPEAVQITAFRVVQESLTNVVKHAQASQVLVSVQRASNGIEVLVLDNGLGQPAGPQRGFGLLGMRERVLAVGGRFEVQHEPGQGYRVYALFPLADAPKGRVRRAVSAEKQ